MEELPPFAESGISGECEDSGEYIHNSRKGILYDIDADIPGIGDRATAGRNTTVQSQLICSLQVCLIPLIN